MSGFPKMTKMQTNCDHDVNTVGLFCAKNIYFLNISIKPRRTKVCVWIPRLCLNPQTTHPLSIARIGALLCPHVPEIKGRCFVFESILCCCPNLGIAPCPRSHISSNHHWSCWLFQPLVSQPYPVPVLSRVNYWCFRPLTWQSRPRYPRQSRGLTQNSFRQTARGRSARVC